MPLKSAAEGLKTSETPSDCRTGFRLNLFSILNLQFIQSRSITIVLFNTIEVLHLHNLMSLWLTWAKIYPSLFVLTQYPTVPQHVP